MSVLYSVLTILLFFSCALTNIHSKRNDNILSKVVKPTMGQVWPKPQNQVSSSTFYVINPENFKFVSNKDSCWILTSAFSRYYKIIFTGYSLLQSRHASPKNSNQNLLATVNIVLSGQCEDLPTYEMNEEYNIQIDSDNGVIASTSVWGILRGLETFSQLVHINQDGQYQVNKTVISDFPRFAHRGVLLDTSRHYLHINLILRVLEAMEYNKMNVFHWHIVDDQSFPYVSAVFPCLSEKGAYQPYTHIYTQADVAFVIHFAQMRGIRVIPEFDTPGHTKSWGSAYPELLTTCYKKGQPDGTFGPFDPSNQDVFKFLQKFFREVLTVFPDQYTHLGGDEVDFTCWKSNPNITDFMTQLNITGDYKKLEEYYENKLISIVEKLGPKKSYVVWQEILDNGVKIKPETIVHVWKEPHAEEMANVTKAGYHTILSSCWYLDYIKTGGDWEQFYQCEPLDFNGTAAQKKLVIGGEACLWGEYVDGTNVVSRLWPRASAIAERLWSNVNVTNLNEAEQRLEEHRCRMISRGIGAQPTNGPNFCPIEYYDVEKRHTYY